MHKHTYHLDDKNGSEEDDQNQTNWVHNHVIIDGFVLEAVQLFVICMIVFLNAGHYWYTEHVFMRLQQIYKQNEHHIYYPKRKDRSISQFFEIIGNPFLFDRVFIDG